MEEPFKVLGRLFDSPGNVRVVGPDQGIAKIVRIIVEYVVVDIESKGSQVFYGEHGGRARVSLSERMYLPDSCYEL